MECCGKGYKHVYFYDKRFKFYAENSKFEVPDLNFSSTNNEWMNSDARSSAVHKKHSY